MKDWVVALMCCPACLSDLAKVAFESDAKGQVQSGVLLCLDQDCHAWYPITHGIPRLLSESLRETLTLEFIQTHHAALVARGVLRENGAASADELLALKQHTIQNFGFEWREFSRFGWDDPVFSLEREQNVFLQKALLEPQELRGKVILDAGCGNGRYTYWAARSGQYVIGVDLGDGVESAHTNTASLENVQIVQGDIFNLPFRKETFDLIFSIGVLMHTGNAKKAVAALTHKLKGRGSISVHLYGKGNVVYEFMDRELRKYTTRKSIPELQQFTRRAHDVRRILERVRMANIVRRFVRLDSHPHCIFDWYSAPIATHHTVAEVEAWFQEFGLKVIKTNGALSSKMKLKRATRALVGGAPTVTVRGIRLEESPA